MPTVLERRVPKPGQIREHFKQPREKSLTKIQAPMFSGRVSTRSLELVLTSFGEVFHRFIERLTALGQKPQPSSRAGMPELESPGVKKHAP